MDIEQKRILMPKNKLAIIHAGSDGVTEYRCVECSARYVDKEKLEVHLCTHNKEYRFLCGICGTGLKRKEHLDRHTLGHQEVRPHVCQVCGKGFKRKEHLTIHLSIHSGDKSQVCPLCQRSFYRKDHLQKHLQTHNKMFVEQNIFPVSDQELMEIKQEMTDDDITLIENGTSDISMEMLGDQNETETRLSMTSHTSTNPERPYACHICEKTYKRKDHLKLHSETHMKKDKVCSECGKAFVRDEQLLSHMSVHIKSFGLQEHDEDLSSSVEPMFEHTDIEILPLETSLLVPRADYQPESRPHECPICHRRFKRKQHLKVHSNVHFKLNTLQPTIWCSLCNEGFHNNSQFENHQCMSSEGHEGGYASTQHAPLDAKKENNYPTEFVEVVEDENTAYSDEPIATAASERDIPTPLRVYVCKYCSKPFKRKDHYRIHLHVHTGVKSLFCPDCGKGFYRKDHLQKHATVHQRVRQKPKKAMPELYPIKMLNKMKEIKPEITITAPSNTKLRVPLQIKVPYQVVMSMDNGERRAVTIDPHDGNIHDDSL